jgi:hypothetical protein
LRARARRAARDSQETTTEDKVHFGDSQTVAWACLAVLRGKIRYARFVHPARQRGESARHETGCCGSGLTASELSTACMPQNIPLDDARARPSHVSRTARRVRSSSEGRVQEQVGHCAHRVPTRRQCVSRSADHRRLDQHDVPGPTEHQYSHIPDLSSPSGRPELNH